ncbi:hypothetical protein [Rosenbergiella australiborealis]|uniref:hypothetical protein n=1 Tax=Rosenbergiella australiborealis TaxID=1544696 RepID=UPI001F4DDCB5|nr:hypothetical protein [Rosenbergiella australiborealis]
MSNLFEYNYPGKYLLVNYERKIYNRLLNNGYIVYQFNSIKDIDYNIIIDSIDYFYIDLPHDDTDYNNLYEFIYKSKITLFKISINCVIKKHLEFIGFLRENGYREVNKEQIREEDKNINLQMVNVKLIQYKISSDIGVNHLQKRLKKIRNYICPGDEILILGNSNDNIRNYLLYKFNSDKIDFLCLTGLPTENKKYNLVIFIDNKVTFNPRILDLISKHLQPSGRCILFNQETSIANILKTVDLDIEAYSNNNDLTAPIVNYNGIIPDILSGILIFMRNPLIFDNFEYNESIYGYNSPPNNLLAFQRDYINPWIVRSLVEFPFRNKSIFNLKNYCTQILENYPALSPDYGSALAVLGYQYLDGHNNDDSIICKIISYCNDILNESHISPHQIRWYISLSTLLGLIYRKKGNFLKAMYWFSKAYKNSEAKFSPTISTKILQSYYMNVTMLLCLGKFTTATIILDSSLNRIKKIFNVHESELLGKKSSPLNFVMYIYHDIIDWSIKLINIKRSLNTQKIELFSVDNDSTWSVLLADRMEAINSQSLMIDERDNTIKDQALMIDERDNTIKDQALMIDERDNTIKDQALMINKRDNTIKNQALMIDERDNALSNQALIIEKLEMISKKYSL